MFFVSLQFIGVLGWGGVREIWGRGMYFIFLKGR